MSVKNNKKKTSGFFITTVFRRARIVLPFARNFRFYMHFMVSTVNGAEGSFFFFVCVYTSFLPEDFLQSLISGMLSE